MQIVSIDIETTGLDPENCDILEFGAIIDSTDSKVEIDQLPHFHCYVLKESYRGEPYALSMHPLIFRRIATKEPGFQYLKPDSIPIHFMNFLIGKTEAGEIKLPVSLIAAGKNFGSFDYQFLRRLENWSGFLKVAHRSIDPSMLYYRAGDLKLPDMKTCLERAGLPGEVKHEALADCKAVLQLLRKAWNYGTALDEARRLSGRQSPTEGTPD